MTLTLKRITSFIFLGAAITLTGCGGSSGGGGGSTGVSYDGVTTAATIDDTNAEALGTTATEATSEAITNANANDGTPFSFAASVSNDSSSSSLAKTITDIARTAAAQMQSQNLPAGITLNATDLGPGYCGGSITVPDDFGQSGTLNGQMTFNNLCFDDGTNGQITMNGTITFSETATTMTISYTNFSVTYNGQTETINGTISCDTNTFSCTFSSDYVGADGKTYRIADFTIGGSDSVGYTISATFYHPDFGSVTIQTTTPITFASTGKPNGGTLEFTSGAATGTITFNTIGYTGSWSDGGNGGSFIGTW